MQIHKIKDKEYYIHTIDYDCTNGFKGSHKILSMAQDPKKVESMARDQLKECGIARFKVLLLNKKKERVTRGCLFRIDKPIFSIY